MPKKYNTNRKCKIKEQKPLTLYEEWIFDLVRKKSTPIKTVFSLRNKLSKQELKKFNLSKAKINSRTPLYNTIKNIEKKLNMPILLSEEQKNKLNIPKGALWRIHATSFTIKILQSLPNYSRLLQNMNKDIFENNTIMLYRNKLTIYGHKDFFGSTVEEALQEEAKYWNWFLKKLQLKYEILLIKRNNTKIYEFRKHYAHVNDPLAKKALKQDKHYYVRDDNGELIFEIDNSFNFEETESVHPRKGKRNAKKYEEILKDMDRHPDSFNFSELTRISTENTNNIKKLLDLSKEIPKLEENILYLEEKLSQQIDLNTNLTKNLLALKKETQIKDNFKAEMNYFL